MSGRASTIYRIAQGRRLFPFFESAAILQIVEHPENSKVFYRAAFVPLQIPLPNLQSEFSNRTLGKYY